MTQHSPAARSVLHKLEAASDPKTKASFHRFFKEEVKFFGVSTSQSKMVNEEEFAKIRHLPKDEVFKICEELFRSQFCEATWIAGDWAYKIADQYEASDFERLEKWVKTYVSNWATCDTLCNHAVGTLIETYPTLISKLKEWTRSNNRWVKRASAVTLIIPARKGLFLKDIFDIADTLLLDPDDMVQKGYGWMLKAASQAHQYEVFEYVMKHKNEMPRTALRYAIEKMPEKLKKEAMKK